MGEKTGKGYLFIYLPTYPFIYLGILFLTVPVFSVCLELCTFWGMYFHSRHCFDSFTSSSNSPSRGWWEKEELLLVATGCDLSPILDGSAC